MRDRTRKILEERGFKTKQAKKRDAGQPEELLFPPGIFSEGYGIRREHSFSYKDEESGEEGSITLSLSDGGSSLFSGQGFMKRNWVTGEEKCLRIINSESAFLP